MTHWREALQDAMYPILTRLPAGGLCSAAFRDLYWP